MANFFNKITIKTKYGATITPVIVIVASVYIAWAYTSHFFKSKHKAPGFLSKSMSVAALHGGKLALERLADYHDALTDAQSLDAAESELKTLLKQEQPDFNKLQRTVAKLEMSRKEAVAVQILEKAVEEARSQRKRHEAYEIQMLLVEMLIYKGDFEEALRCECLDEEKISDARRPLYKAIIHIMSGSHENAVSCWRRFTEIRLSFEWPLSDLHDSQLEEAVLNFDKFEKVVSLLKQHIKETPNRN